MEIASAIKDQNSIDLIPPRPNKDVLLSQKEWQELYLNPYNRKYSAWQEQSRKQQLLINEAQDNWLAENKFQFTIQEKEIIDELDANQVACLLRHRDLESEKFGYKEIKEIE